MSLWSGNSWKLIGVPAVRGDLWVSPWERVQSGPGSLRLHRGKSRTHLHNNCPTCPRQRAFTHRENAFSIQRICLETLRKEKNPFSLPLPRQKWKQTKDGWTNRRERETQFFFLATFYTFVFPASVSVHLTSHAQTFSFSWDFFFIVFVRVAGFEPAFFLLEWLLKKIITT